MTRYISDYTTPDAVIRQLEKSDPSDTPSPAQAEFDEFYAIITSYIPMVSQFISDETFRVFVPYKETKSYYFNELEWDRNYTSYRGLPTLYLDEDLLVTSSITWDSTLLSASTFREATDHMLPFWAIRFDPQNLQSWGADFDSSIDVEATWGFHHNLSQAYTESGDTATITDSATSITVASGAKARYEILQYIRIESELMQITDIPDTTTLTVLRGVNGHTAAEHTSQLIEIYSVIDSIAEAATRLTAWAYNHRNDLGDRIQFPDGSSVITQVPTFVRETLRNYTRSSIEAV